MDGHYVRYLFHHVATPQISSKFLNGIIEQNVIICHCINNSFSSTHEGISFHDHIIKNLNFTNVAWGSI